MPDVHYLRDGTRRIELYVPFTAKQLNGQDVQVTAVTLGPYTLGHTTDFKAGRFASSLDFMCKLANLDISVIRQLRDPDADRVTGAFMDMLPDWVRGLIASGKIPQAVSFRDPQTGDEEPIAPEPPQHMPADEEADERGFDLNAANG